MAGFGRPADLKGGLYRTVDARPPVDNSDPVLDVALTPSDYNGMGFLSRWSDTTDSIAFRITIRKRPASADLHRPI